jgi:DNA-binding NarL/FixJ family response regulator
MRCRAAFRSDRRPLRGTTPDRAKIAIVVGSDSPILRAGLRTMLASERDIEVVAEAATIVDARRLVATRRPDVLLIAVAADAAGNPGVVGQPWLGRFDIPIILITRVPEPAACGLMSIGGPVSYVDIKVTRARLAEAVRRTAHGERVVSPMTDERSLRSGAVLSAPELAVLRLLAEGQTNRAIAVRLRYSVGTVKDYIQRILEKLDASNRTQAAVKALRAGVLS